MSFAYEVVIPDRVAKAIRQLDESVKERVIDRIEALRTEPRAPGTVAMRNEANTYRVRIADYRVVYEVRDAEHIVLIVQVGHRREVYR